MGDKLEIGEICTAGELFDFLKRNQNVIILSNQPKSLDFGNWAIAHSKKFEVCNIGSADWAKCSNSPPLSDVTIYYVKFKPELR
jgi:hypothetical protein